MPAKVYDLIVPTLQHENAIKTLQRLRVTEKTKTS